MEAYTGFAQVYDTFMDNVPYEEWVKYLCGLLKEYGVDNGLVLDLGCGTGTVTELLAAAGYDMIGVDNSEEMLNIAMEKKQNTNFDILYLLQDMREFELYGTVKAVVSICDSLNYITEAEELKKVFTLINNYLDTRGIFVFDFNTVYKYKEVMGECTIAETREECSFIWDNYYYEEEKINEYELTVFVQDRALKKSCGEDLYRKFKEVHYQKGYTLEEMKMLLEASGMEFVTAYDAFTKESPHDKSERIYVVAREKGKSQEIE